MKKYIFIILVSSYFSAAHAQMLIMQKRWETNLSVLYGHNYSSGYDISLSVNIRINGSNWGIYGDFTRTDENVKVAGENRNFPVNGFYPSLGITHSLRERLSPTPFDIIFNGGFTHGSAKLNLADGQQVKENSFGNHLGISVKYMFTPKLSILLRQTLHILYDSPFGNTRTTTSAGLSFTFR